MRKFTHAVFALILGGGALALVFAYGDIPPLIPQVPPLLDSVLFAGLCLVAVMAGARLPDLIEPGINRGHRGLFHSKGMAFLLIGCMVILMFLYSRLGFYSPILIMLCLGYVSHLFLDGLPFGKLPD
ncbi:MAG TPA: hypothetical protein ENN76_00075 [Euryarchaeota archaeon]|mgnify:CR=1 FL=1|nr:hypothetical protein [Euryarchaeota archaeon]